LPVKVVANAGGGRGARGGRGGNAANANAGNAANPANAGAQNADAAATQQADPRPQTETREFPAGSYIIRMDQPYSRIADALLYKLRDADIQAAEEPFEASGTNFKRGSFVIRNVSQSDLDATTKDLGLKATAVASAPSVKMHPVRAARVAVMHTWQNTQTEGW